MRACNPSEGRALKWLDVCSANRVGFFDNRMFNHVMTFPSATDFGKNLHSPLSFVCYSMFV